MTTTITNMITSIRADSRLAAGIRFAWKCGSERPELPIGRHANYGVHIFSRVVDQSSARGKRAGFVVSNTMMFFLAGLFTMALHGLSWITRKKEGGPMFGYYSSWDAIAPFGVAMGVVMMLISACLWLFSSNPP
jgi:hypothetical protein